MLNKKEVDGLKHDLERSAKELHGLNVYVTELEDSMCELEAENAGLVKAFRWFTGIEIKDVQGFLEDFKRATALEDDTQLLSDFYQARQEAYRG